jgi:Holliday junction DNA helicase RuvA
MIENISGRISSLTPTSVVLDTAGGVGYLLNITLPTFSKLEHAQEAKLLVHESIREDAWVLFGFIDEQEREMFRSLIGVSGVGAGTARVILSAIPSNELGSVIAASDVRRLKNVKGIGAKTAERIIVDLRDKIKSVDATLLEQTLASSDVYDEALAALIMLGFARQQSQKALKAIFEADPSTKVDVAIKKALAMM